MTDIHYNSRNTPYDVWNVECGKGWEKLYQPLIDQCTAEGVDIHQVKEKFGGLRFYIGGGASPTLLKMIDDAEVDSYKTCEDCGAVGRIHPKMGWMRTLCEDHYNDYVKSHNAYGKLAAKEPTNAT